jgi:hypothetical protein
MTRPEPERVKARQLSDDDLAEVAATMRHEAAHAVACLRHGQPFTRVRFYEGGIERGTARICDVCCVTVPDGYWPVSEDARIFAFLAGPAAEWTFKGGISDEQIVSVAREAIGRTPEDATGMCSRRWIRGPGYRRSGLRKQPTSKTGLPSRPSLTPC